MKITMIVVATLAMWLGTCFAPPATACGEVYSVSLAAWQGDSDSAKVKLGYGRFLTGKLLASAAWEHESGTGLATSNSLGVAVTRLLRERRPRRVIPLASLSVNHQWKSGRQKDYYYGGLGVLWIPVCNVGVRVELVAESRGYKGLGAGILFMR